MSAESSSQGNVIGLTLEDVKEWIKRQNEMGFFAPTDGGSTSDSVAWGKGQPPFEVAKPLNMKGVGSDLSGLDDDELPQAPEGLEKSTAAAPSPPKAGREASQKGQVQARDDSHLRKYDNQYNLRESFRLDRAREYVRNIPPARSGSGNNVLFNGEKCGGHKFTLIKIQQTINGFELRDNEATAIFLEEWNNRCEPPWSEGEIKHKVDEARKYINEGKVYGEVGYLFKKTLVKFNEFKDKNENSKDTESNSVSENSEPENKLKYVDIVNSQPTKSGKKLTYNIQDFIKTIKDNKEKGFNYFTTLNRFWRVLAEIRFDDEKQFKVILAEIKGIKGYTKGSFNDSFDPHYNAARRARINASGDDLSGIPFTDLGNSIRMIKRYGKNIKYCGDHERFMVWDGRRWTNDVLNQVQEFAKDTAWQIQYEAPKNVDGSTVSDYEKWSIISQSKLNISAMIKMMASYQGTGISDSIAVKAESFDTDIMLLNVLNGTIDLRTMEFREHRRSDMITKCADVEFDESATCPTFEWFIQDVMEGDMETVDYLQRAIGYCLTGLQKEHFFMFLYGVGRNGKNTLIDIINSIMGDYSCEVSTDLITATENTPHPAGITELEGRRFIFMNEIEEGKRMATALMKKITGGPEQIQGRKMYGHPYYFKPTHHIWMSTNHKPEIREVGPAIWDRVKPVHFNIQYSFTIPGARIPDLELDTKINQERSGILNWMLAGLVKYFKYGLKPSKKVLDALAEYRGEQDIIEGFIREKCIVEPDAKESMSKLYPAYKEWCERYDYKPMGVRRLGSVLSDKTFKSKPSNGETWKIGLRLKNPEERIRGKSVQIEQGSENSINVDSLFKHCEN